MYKKVKLVMLPKNEKAGVISIGNKSGVAEYHLFQHKKEGIYLNHTFYHLYILIIYLLLQPLNLGITMGTSIAYKRIWSIAYPIILGSLAQNIINVTDTAFLGRVGHIALGAAAIGGIFYIAIIMLGWGFGIGTQIIVARRFGEGDMKSIGRTIEHSLYFLLILALISFVVIKYLSSSILSATLNSEDVFNASVRFLNYRAYGVFFAFINVAFRAFYIGISKTKVITWTTCIMAAFNIFFDYILIFGKFGFREYGIEGAAMASVIAEISATIFFIGFTLRNIPLKKYCLFYFRKFEITLFKRILNVSVPVMLQNFVSISGWFLFFIFVENLGEKELAISNIVRSFYVILMIPVWGFCSAANTLVSMLIGQEKFKEVMPLIIKIAKMCLASVLILVSLTIIDTDWILKFYSDDLTLIKMSKPVLYVVIAAVLGISIAFIFFNGVSGTGKTRVSFAIEYVVIMIYLLGIYLVTNVFKMPIRIVWCSELFYAILLGVLSYFYLKFGNWKRAVI